MKIYMVGGAVRDMILGRKVKDYDFVVVGSSPEEMLALGFQQVGASFPVFLHPVTKQEYALARTERKNGHGYHGFDVDFNSSVTLEDDLLRRDLTINSMAYPVEVDLKTGEFTVTENLIDPYGGGLDSIAYRLEITSDAFRDDPVRVLRVGRFAATLGFDPSPKTMKMMKEMVESGELNHLTAERVWLELYKTLKEKNPRPFFDVLHDCGALKVILPEIDALFGIPQTEKWHPEIDTGIHTLMTLDEVCKLSPDPVVRFAALTHDLGKALTPKEELPSHTGHEESGVALVEALCDRLKLPNEYKDLATKVCRWHLHVHKAFELQPKTIQKVFEGLDLYRRPALFQPFLDAVEADARGRLGMGDRNYFQRIIFEQAFVGAQRVTAQPFVEAGLKGKDIAEAMRIARITAIRKKVATLKRFLKEDKTSIG